MSVARIKSPAKVNLFLKVLGKRQDGFHDIYTLIQPVSLFDEISLDVREGEGISVECDREDVPGGRENLAFQAAELFLSEAELQKAVGIKIRKKIPVAGGLGGGSSNAAAVIMGLDHALGLALGEETLMEMAARLGSDVPLFILRGPALGSARGEVLERVELPPFNYCLVNPGFKVSTAWAYGNLDLTKKGEDNILTYSKESLKKPENIKELLFNDLEGVTLRNHPEISRIERILTGAGALGALMSGSGPTVFGIFPDRDSTEKASLVIRSELPGEASVFTATGLTGKESEFWISG
jgi:4-diphosphocytidyl-2-C-methyl-D-erythritol kinase